MNNKDNIKDNMYALYEVYNQYKLLYNFYQKYKSIKNEEDIRERIEYLKKNPKCSMRDEISTLLWVIGEVADV